VSLAKPPSQNSTPSSSENLVFANGRLCADFRPLSVGGLLRNPDGEPMSERPEPNHPARVGRLRSLGAVLGCDTEGAPKRLTLKGNYSEPSLPFPDRMQWLAKVQRLIAVHSRDGKSFPHKVGSVAYAIAHVGNVCRLGLDGIADRAGCVVSTAQACIAWLEEQGALTWSHTARRHSNGRMVRSANLYTLITNFEGLVATIARAVRATWRERPRSSNTNQCHGLTQTVSFIDREEARKRLSEVRKAREAQQLAIWNARHAT
jgi:hypothetical protein